MSIDDLSFKSFFKQKCHLVPALQLFIMKIIVNFFFFFFCCSPKAADVTVTEVHLQYDDMICFIALFVF